VPTVLFYDFTIIPTIPQLFPADNLVRNALERHLQTRYVYPLALMTAQDVRAISSIGKRSVEVITVRLREHQLFFRYPHIRVKQVTEHLFGSPQQAPISLLHMAIKDGVPTYQPLQVIRKLEEALPELAVCDVLAMKHAELRQEIGHCYGITERDVITRYASQVVGRLDHWGFKRTDSSLLALA
jgi:hypothetical protein